MVTQIIDPKKASFWTEIFCTCDIEKMHILVLATKTEICNLATINDADVICHTIMHRMSCDDFVVHISVLLLKQNIC